MRKPSTLTSQVPVGPLFIRSKTSPTVSPPTEDAQKNKLRIPPTQLRRQSRKTEKVLPPKKTRPEKALPPDALLRQEKPQTTQPPAPPDPPVKLVNRTIQKRPREPDTPEAERKQPRGMAALSWIAIGIALFSFGLTRQQVTRLSILQKLETTKTPPPPPLEPVPPPVPDVVIDGNYGEKVAVTLAGLEREFERVKARNKLRFYADQAISTGSRFALWQLIERQKKPEFPELTDAATAEIMRVESHFITTRRFRKYALPLSQVFSGAQSPGDIRTDQLLWAVSDPTLSWEIRAFAARSLSKRKGAPSVPATLVKSAQSEADLRVLQEIIVSFGQVTGFYSSSIFASKEAASWWENHAPETQG